MSPPIVVIESPYRGNEPENIEYAHAALLDCLQRGEAPVASHILYTTVLVDRIAAQRKLGMEAGWAFYKAADRAVIYLDLGLTDGMRKGINEAVSRGVPVEYRKITGWGE